MIKDNYKEHLYALILAGGGGTRLWPKSREKTPKQFLPLFNKQTLTQITLRRLTQIVLWPKIYIVTVSEEYKKEILKEIPSIIPKNIIVEPQRRETGPAHGLGALCIYKDDPEAVIITESADRLVRPIPLYLKTLLHAAKIAFEEKKLIAMGIEPRYPHSGLGHIKKGEKVRLPLSTKFYKLEKFVEKPPLELATEYTKSGDYLWNAGQFVWRADVLLESFKKNAPDIYDQLEVIEKDLFTKNETKTINHCYEKMPKIAIDYAIAEKDKNFYVVEAEFFWTDIGDWKEVWENLPKDSQGNVFIDGDAKGGRIINIDTSDALIHTDGRLIAIIDVDNIAVVDTEDVLLICSKSRAQNVKKVVEQLKEEKRTDLL